MIIIIASVMENRTLNASNRAFCVDFFSQSHIAKKQNLIQYAGGRKERPATMRMKLFAIFINSIFSMNHTECDENVSDVVAYSDQLWCFIGLIQIFPSFEWPMTSTNDKANAFFVVVQIKRMKWIHFSFSTFNSIEIGFWHWNFVFSPFILFRHLALPLKQFRKSHFHSSNYNFFAT